HCEIAKIDGARNDHLFDGIALICNACDWVFAGKETHVSAPSYSLVLSIPRRRIEKTLCVTCCNIARLLEGKIRKPAAIFIEYSIVTEPALVDPGIGTEQKAIGIPLEWIVPICSQFSSPPIVAEASF